MNRKIVIVIILFILFLGGCLSSGGRVEEDLDSDGDGLTDDQEALLRTNPYQSDSDGDGIEDKVDPNPLVPEAVTNTLKQEPLLTTAATTPEPHIVTTTTPPATTAITKTTSTTRGTTSTSTSTSTTSSTSKTTSTTTTTTTTTITLPKTPPLLVWNKTIYSGRHEEPFSFEKTSDGGFIIGGVQTTHEGDWDFYIAKTDSEGNLMWSRTFGTSGSDYAYSARQTSDGGYIIAGKFSGLGGSDAKLIKTDSNGNEIWSRIYGGTGADFVTSVQQTSDGGYIIAGYTDTMGAGKEDFFLVKTDANGDEIWKKTFGGPERDIGGSVEETSDGGYIIAGSTSSFGDERGNVYLIKTDEDGNEEWSKTFGGSKTNYAAVVQKTSDGGYILMGSTGSHPVSDLYLIKTDANGDGIWSRNFDTGRSERGNSLAQTPDGGYILAGRSYDITNEGYYIVKTNSNGNKEWDKYIPLVTSGQYIQITPNGYMMAVASYNGLDWDIMIIKLAHFSDDGILIPLYSPD